MRMRENVSSLKGAFNRGSSNIAAEEEAAAEARKAGYSDGRLPFFGVKDKQTKYIRLLTAAEGDEGWFRFAQHSGVKTKPAPADMEDKSKWPTQMGGVCRNDKQFKHEAFDTIFATRSCYICENKLMSTWGNKVSKPSNKTWALAVERTQVKGDGSKEMGGPAMLGKVLGFGDVTEEYEVRDEQGEGTGVMAVRPRIVVINQSFSNFFAPIHYLRTTTGSDERARDFAIRRVGEGKDTEYHVMPLDPTPDLTPDTPAWKRYDDEIARREIDLGEIILRQASDEHMARWFDVTKVVDKEGNITEASAAEVASAQAAAQKASTGVGEVDSTSQASMDALRARLMGATPSSTPS